MKLSDQIREKLEQRRDRFIQEQIAEIKANREFAPYEYDIHSFELGCEAGGNSMLPLIVKLVAALEITVGHYERDEHTFEYCMEYIYKALADLKRDLDINE